MKHDPHLDDREGEGLSPSTSHPAYVAVAPDWFWAEDDGRAPFGNDDGNDTLRALEEYYADGGGDGHVPGHIANLIVEWALVPETVWESSQQEIVDWLEADDGHVRSIHGEIDAYIAAACGQFKISGWIHPALRFWAERAMMLLEHVLAPWEKQAFDAEPGRYDDRLAATRAVIDAAPNPPRRFRLRQYRGTGQ